MRYNGNVLTGEEAAIVGMVDEFEAVCDAYMGCWPVGCVLAGADGAVRAGEVPPCDAAACRATRARAIYEAVRWGEPTLEVCPGGFVLWAVPVMVNARVLGGIIAEHVDVGPVGEGPHTLGPAQVRRATAELLRLVTAANLTNAALLAAHRETADREAQRAEAIHALKGLDYVDVRHVYLVEEPALITAIKEGDRHAARGILNRVLTGIYFAGDERPPLLKSLLLELVTTMTRSAVEAGGDPTDVLGAHYALLTEMAAIDTEEALCAWVVTTLERIMDAIAAHNAYPAGILLRQALQYMRDHLHEELTRDDVAQQVRLSPAHFGRVLKRACGCSFTDMLTRMRVERACHLLQHTAKELVQVSVECGFCDQSYFSKVFRKVMGCTPGEYRRHG